MDEAVTGDQLAVCDNCDLRQDQCDLVCLNDRPEDQMLPNGLERPSGRLHMTKEWDFLFTYFATKSYTQYGLIPIFNNTIN